MIRNVDRDDSVPEDPTVRDEDADETEASAHLNDPILPSERRSQIRLEDLGAQLALNLDTQALLRGIDFRQIANIDVAIPSSPDLSKSMRTAIANIASRLDELQTPKLQSILRDFDITRQFRLAASSVPSLYANLGTAAHSIDVRRATRSAQAFFNEHAASIDGVPALLRAQQILQTKNHGHKLVWRGQQRMWPVESGLRRALEFQHGDVDEDDLIEAEKYTLQQARDWGLRSPHSLETFADLQHYGAPTRLLDISTDPDVAAWFATASNPEHDTEDGLIICWGRIPKLSGHRFGEPVSLPVSEPVAPFWHAYKTIDDRRAVDWGTGTRTWAWLPRPLNDRMRAQRGGFLIEAGPILTAGVLGVFDDHMSQDWRASEIAAATSILGLPSRHDRVTRVNRAHLVPIFTLRIEATAKPLIRDYLSTKGLDFQTVYPDKTGLVAHLRNRFPTE